jgi:hypothetical protein
MPGKAGVLRFTSANKVNHACGNLQFFLRNKREKFSFALTKLWKSIEDPFFAAKSVLLFWP